MIQINRVLTSRVGLIIKFVFSAPEFPELIERYVPGEDCISYRTVYITVRCDCTAVHTVLMKKRGTRVFTKKFHNSSLRQTFTRIGCDDKCLWFSPLYILSHRVFWSFLEINIKIQRKVQISSRQPNIIKNKIQFPFLTQKYDQNIYSQYNSEHK